MATDPIWAALEEWKRAGSVHKRTFKREDAWNATTRATCDAYHAAARKMARTIPTTREGAAALLHRMVYDMERGENDWQIRGLKSVAKFLRH